MNETNDGQTGGIAGGGVSLGPITVDVKASATEIMKAALLDSVIGVAKERGLLQTEHDDVKDFHTKFGLLVGDRPGHLTKRKLKERVECMLEELQEFAEACGLELQSHNGSTSHIVVAEIHGDQDLSAQADALIDLVYFAKGTSVMLGLPWSELWDDVQRANMAKVRGVGKRGHAVDCVKPEGWIGPQTGVILREADYDRSEWTEYQSLPDTPILEEACRDDVLPEEPAVNENGGWFDGNQ